MVFQLPKQARYQLRYTRKCPSADMGYYTRWDMKKQSQFHPLRSREHDAMITENERTDADGTNGNRGIDDLVPGAAGR